MHGMVEEPNIKKIATKRPPSFSNLPLACRILVSTYFHCFPSALKLAFENEKENSCS
jgi:hypothetical protein